MLHGYSRTCALIKRCVLRGEKLEILPDLEALGRTSEWESHEEPGVDPDLVPPARMLCPGRLHPAPGLRERGSPAIKEGCFHSSLVPGG